MNQEYIEQEEKERIDIYVVQGIESFKRKMSPKKGKKIKKPVKEELTIISDSIQNDVPSFVPKFDEMICVIQNAWELENKTTY